MDIAKRKPSSTTLNAFPVPSLPARPLALSDGKQPSGTKAREDEEDAEASSSDSDDMIDGSEYGEASEADSLDIEDEDFSGLLEDDSIMEAEVEG